MNYGRRGALRAGVPGTAITTASFDVMVPTATAG